MSEQSSPSNRPQIDAPLLRGMTQRRISRRDLLKYAGAGAGAMGLSAFLAACGVSGTSDKGTKKAAAFDWSKARKAGQLNFANWPLYIDSSEPGVHPSLEKFTKETGIEVNYRPVINENESFLATIIPSLQAGKPTDWDLMVITGGMPINRLIRNNWLIPLDHSRLPNFKQYARPSVKDPNYDPGNRFSIAWQSGMTGIGYNSKKVGREIKSFHDLFDPAFKGKVGLFGDNQDLPNLTLVGLGIDPAESTPDDWQKAADFLIDKRDAGIIRSFYEQDYIDALQNGDTWISMAWSGDIFAVATYEGHPELKYVVPEEGGVFWTDNMVIPAKAAHPLDAIMYMDFVYRPEIAAMIADWVAYTSPVPAAKEIILNEI